MLLLGFATGLSNMITMTTISSTRIRNEHNTFALVLHTVLGNAAVKGTLLWTAPADGAEVKAGDKWVFITHVGGVELAAAKKGWMAYIHKGVPICKNFIDDSIPPPPPPPVPVFPDSFTLTAPDGSKAEYQFVRVLP